MPYVSIKKEKYEDIHKLIVAFAISLTAMFVAIPIASARTIYPIGQESYPSVNQLLMHSGPSQNDWISAVAGSSNRVCVAYWADGETLYFVGNGQLQPNNTWYDMYGVNPNGTYVDPAAYYGQYPEGWSNSIYVKDPTLTGCNPAYAIWQ